MKTNKVFTATLIAALVFTACSNDEEMNNSREEVKIVATIGSTADSKLKAAFESDGSGEFETGDTFMLNCFSPSEGRTRVLDYSIGNTTLYWDEISFDGNPLNINAWYPVYYNSSDKELYNVATESDKDLLMAPLVSSVTKGNIVNLQFGHVMHKLVITLTSNYYTDENLEDAQIDLHLKTQAMVDYANGRVIAAEASSEAGKYDSSTGAFAEYIVAPQELTPEAEFIEIALVANEIERIFTYKVPSGLAELESGKTLKLNLDVRRDGVVLNYGSISAWGIQDEISEEINFYEDMDIIEK